MNSSPAIVVENLEKTYRDGLIFRKSIQALRGVSLEVARGTIFGLLGPNGAGKTTLIKVLIGIVRKSNGSAQLLGFPAGDRRGRRRVGYLPETHRIPRHLNAYNALEYYGSLSGMSPRQVRSKRDGLLETVGLKGWGSTSVTKFSKGMQQRLGLAQAMLHDPDLLILDEPTDGVDPVGRSEMREVLRRLKQEGKTVFINSHLLQEIELVCDRVAIMDKGKVIKSGLIEEITRRREAGLDILVVGESQTVWQVLKDHDVESVAPQSENRLRLSLRIREQGQLDSAIDALRGASISILEIVRRRDTLEEAFLQIMKTK